MRTVIAALCALTVAALAGAQTSPPAASSSGFDVAFIDRTANACTDFYQFACGNWMATHPLPPDKSRFNRMAELADRNEMIVRSILERAAARTIGRSVKEQKIGDY